MKPFDSIICVTQTTWEGDFQKAVVQLTTELSERHRILFVNYPCTVKDLVMILIGRRDAPIRPLLGLAPPSLKKRLQPATKYLSGPRPCCFLPTGYPIRFTTGSFN